jgi:ligand-binding SRPBCC domain-containing protein
MACHLEFAHWIPLPLERVFRFFGDPQNLPRIMPPQLQARIVELRLKPPVEDENSQLAGVGSEIVTSFRLPIVPLRYEWIARITEFEWNHHFADDQAKGPFKSFHHRHEFVAADREGVSGTLVQDVIDLEVGFGLFGVIAEGLFIRRQLRQTFQYRQQTLEKLLTPGEADTLVRRL